MIHSVAVGRLGKDAEFDGKLTKFSLAVSVKKGASPVWLSCASSAISENLRPFLKKGRPLAVRGSLNPVVVGEKTYLNVFVEGVDFLPEARESVGTKDSAETPRQTFDRLQRHSVPFRSFKKNNSSEEIPF